MNFKKNLQYFVGLDIGTDSVGYAAVNPDYSLCRFKGEPMWGVTLFDAANQSAERRSCRSARRRLERRKNRVRLLRELFCSEIAKTDEKFFIRLDESALLSEDKTVFDTVGCEWYKREYLKKYPTIHHLIAELMSSDNKFDIRLIYTACAWLVVHRGHFLNDISADNIAELSNMSPLYDRFMQWFTDNGYDTPWECDVNQFKEILSEKARISDKEKKLLALLNGGKKFADNPDEFPFSKAAMVKLLCGGSLKPQKLFICDDSTEQIEGSICLDKPEDLERIMGELGENAELLQNMSAIYDCAVLSKILSGFSSISEEKVDEYNRHKKDLAELKRLVKKYCSKKDYDEMFRIGAACGYSKYVANYKADHGKTPRDKRKNFSRDEFYAAVKSLLKNISPDCDADIKAIDDIQFRMGIGTYIPKQVNPDNRVIPHQVYLSELMRILKNAAMHYPFLSECDEDGISVIDKIKSVFLFRIPYFVGPLNNHSSHAWIEKKSSDKIYPWNFEKIVDFDKCEQAFINRMTNTCSYLPDQDVLPKNSLLYCKYTVLNEINNIKINGAEISVDLKQQIFNELFMPNGHNRAKVTKKALAAYLVSLGIIEKGNFDAISGLNIEIQSSMRPAFDFYNLMKCGKLSENDAEDIITHSTYIEDRKRFRKWLSENYTLSAEDIKYLSGKKYSDFGRLSGKLLNGLEGVCRETGEIGTVMHFLWNTNRNLSQILADDSLYTFRETIEKINKDFYAQNKISLSKRIEDMRLPVAVRRPIMRTIDIVSDIVKAKGCAPEKLFIEMPRGLKPGEKKERKLSRRDTLSELFKSMKTPESLEMLRELDKFGDNADNRLQSESLFLYCQQMGKCAYCGKPIDVAALGTDEYNVDHIWPQAYIKDDSIHNNKVLVHSTENGLKSDTYPLPSEWREKMTPFWAHLRKAKLISDEKYKRLTRLTPFTDDEKMGFINRQLVETSQSSKAVAKLLGELYPECEIVYVKANRVSEFRQKYGEIKNYAFNMHLNNSQMREMSLVKSRTANDAHHANDAYLNIVVGNVYHERFTKKWFNIKTDRYSLNCRVIFGKKFNSAPEVWEPEKHLPIVDKVMRNQHMHLTKFQTQQKGGLFDQMPLAAGNDKLIPRKKGLDPVKYGGYNKTTASFFALVRYKKGKNYELTILPVDLMIAEEFKTNYNFKVEYVKQKLGDKISEISFPLGNRILKINTVFSLDGFDVCISGKANGGAIVLTRSLTTAYYPLEHIAYIKRIERIREKLTENKDYVINEDYDGVSQEQNLRLFNYIYDKINSSVFSKTPGSGLKLDENALENFISLTIMNQLDCLANMVLFLKTNRAGGCSMETLGGKKSTGIVLLSANISNWKYSDIRIVDRSAAGLFETRSQNLKELL